jgi:hypothetical protein
MAVLKDEFIAANKRANERTLTAVAAHYDTQAERVVIRLSSGLDLSFKPRDAQGLEHTTPADLAEIEISPSGCGLHFPAVDADVYLPSLLEGFLGSRKWMAARLGAIGGQVSTDAKASAARANGKRGGRPKKTAAVEHA